MPLFNIPVTNTSYNYIQEVTLDGKVFNIELKYNSRKDGWILSLLTYNKEILVSGIKLRVGIDLLEQFRHIDSLPDGRLVVVNFEDNEEANLDNFGTKVLLTYIGVS